MALTVAIHTLGCRLNQAEEALLAGRLGECGFQIVPWGARADLVVINSCAVTGAAAQKTRQAVHAARRHCPTAFIAVVGCGVTVDAQSWCADGTADLVVPSSRKLDLPGLLPAGLARPARPQAAAEAPPATGLFTVAGHGLYTRRTRANLKIQDGCDFGCSYCVVPRARGSPRSRAWDDALREARDLLGQGHREIVLTGVNVALYEDRGRRLADLIEALLALPGEFRLRLSSLEPGPEQERVLAVMAANPRRLCRFLHLPLQYGEDGILRAMHRRYTTAEYAAFARSAVERVPGLCLGSDLIIGFPGETEEQFAACCRTVESLPLAYLHVFAYSPRPGTVAAALPGRIHGSVVAARRRRLDVLAARKAATFAAAAVGQVLEVLTEHGSGEGAAEGLSDNYLRVRVCGRAEGLAPNRFVRVRIASVLAGGGRVEGVPVGPGAVPGGAPGGHQTEGGTA